jgi:hypothetical protein
MRRVLAGFAVAALVACGGATSPSDTVAGHYEMVRASGQDMPAYFTYGAVLQKSIDLNTNGTFGVMQIDSTYGGQLFGVTVVAARRTHTWAGSWTFVTGSALIMAYPAPDSYNDTLSVIGTTLKLRYRDGRTDEYQKR